MRKIVLAFVILFPILTACQSANAPTAITPEKKLALYAQRDKTDESLVVLQGLPVWVEYQRALEAQKAANAAADAAAAKVKATPEGKVYVQAADEYATSIQALLKGVDQTKWTLTRSFDWKEVPATPAPKAASDKK
jgi:hypothetical protein